MGRLSPLAGCLLLAAFSPGPCLLDEVAPRLCEFRSEPGIFEPDLGGLSLDSPLKRGPLALTAGDSPGQGPPPVLLPPGSWNLGWNAAEEENAGLFSLFMRQFAGDGSLKLILLSK